MSRNKTYTVLFKRKRKGKTNYRKRLQYLKSEKERIVVRPTTNNMTIQAVLFEENGDKVLITMQAKELKKIGWKYHLGNLPSSYLAGLYFGMLAKAKIKGGIIDLGLRKITKGDRISAAIKGIVDSGLEIPHSESIFPDEKRLNGTTIAEYSKKLSENKEKYEKQFSKYLKEGIKPENIQKDFEDAKKAILSKK